MAIVEAELAEMAEVFLPYTVTKSGNTLYKEIENGGFKLLKWESEYFLFDSVIYLLYIGKRVYEITGKKGWKITYNILKHIIL